MHLSNVDLPDPEGPIMDNTSPFSTLKEISFNTTLSPKLFLRFLTSNKLMISLPMYRNNPISFQSVPSQMLQSH